MSRFRITALLMGLLFSVLASSVVTAQTTGADPVSLAQAFANTLNAEKSDEALALFSEDAVINSPLIPGSPFVGKQQIRNFILDARGRHQVNQIVSKPEVVGDKVSAIVHVADDRYRNIGLEFIEFKGELVAQGGKIKSYTAIFSPQEVARIKAAKDKATVAQTAIPQSAPSTGQGNSMVSTTSLPGWVLVVLLGGSIVSFLGLMFAYRRLNNTKP